MEKPLKEHISKLEARLEKLSVLIMQNKASREQTNQLEAEILAIWGITRAFCDLRKRRKKLVVF